MLVRFVDMRWICFGSVLGMFWRVRFLRGYVLVCFRCVLDMFWVCVGYVLACVLSALICFGMCLICFEYVWGMCWRAFCLRWYVLRADRGNYVHGW